MYLVVIMGSLSFYDVPSKSTDPSNCTFLYFHSKQRQTSFVCLCITLFLLCYYFIRFVS